MTLFLSYAHQDLDVVTSLRRDLEDLGQTVWLDESLHGGQIWWDEILRQVRSCNGFILAVSALSLDSEACLAEWEYAVALARPFLPVRIDATEWTAAPDRMRQSQHIDYKPDDADSVKALVRSLGGFAQAVPLPTVLPPSPPTPLSYHERYAKLFGQAALTFDDQITYFARLTTDIDSANAKEALELLTVLRNREDLTVKMGKRIDEFLAQRNNTVATAPPGVAAAEAVDAAEVEATVDELVQPGPSESDDAIPPLAFAKPPGPRRMPWILAGVGGVLVLAGILFFALRPKGDDNAAPLVENTECDAYNCSDPPIQFLDITGDPAAIKVTITDPHGVPRDADPPNEHDGGLEWHWSASTSDPIGDYTVHFEGNTGGPTDRDFTVNAIEGPFGAVQKAGQAITQHKWDEAAAIDNRVKEELDASGSEALDAEYPLPGQMYWVPYDASGRTNDNGTTIVGAFVSYVDDNGTTATCQLWSVDPGNQTMRSDSLPRGETAHTYFHTGAPIESEISSFVENDCKNLVSTD